MESLQVAVDWILRIVITLFVPALVWVAVIVGLISIVRDKVHKEEVTLPRAGHIQGFARGSAVGTRAILLMSRVLSPSPSQMTQEQPRQSI